MSFLIPKEAFLILLIFRFHLRFSRDDIAGSTFCQAQILPRITSSSESHGESHGPEASQGRGPGWLGNLRGHRGHADNLS